MAILSYTTELEAVNAMLASIGLSPVPDLEDIGIEDANRARDTLRATTRAVLTRGYDFNTDKDYTLTPDTSKLIAVPQGVLELDPSDNTRAIVMRRHPDTQMRLWDKDGQTWEFDEAVEVDVVWGFPFEDLPETARAFISVSAGRQFQQGSVGAQILDAYEAEEEQRLRLMLEKREAKSRRANIFRNNSSASAAVNNRRY